jgi:hypothetical protein
MTLSNRFHSGDLEIRIFSSDDLDLPVTAVQSDLPPYFKQKSNDPNVFSEDHGGVKVS